MQKNERSAAILQDNMADTSNDKEELFALLVRRKQESDKRIAALENARSRVAFFGRPRKRAAHPRHILFADCFDEWPLPRIEEELGHEHGKNDALERELARTKALLHPSLDSPAMEHGTKPIEIFSHSPDYRSVSLHGRIFNLTTRQAQVIEMLHAAFKNRHPDVAQAAILERLQTGGRLRDTFRKNGKTIPAWKALVIQGERKGTFRLSVQLSEIPTKSQEIPT
jgi:hypothetical protein